MSRLWAYVILTRPDVTFLVAITSLAGFYHGSETRVDLLRMAQAVFGTLLIAGGTSALNQYFEREEDALMRRTARRPLPASTLQPAEVFLFGLALCAFGGLYLAVFSGWLAALIGVVTCVSYLACYTPLKTRTTWATFVGAFPGAAPPLIGWAAASGSLSPGAWILFAILFFWQFPHFLAIAWMYREDYARAGIRMLPTVDPEGHATFRQVVGYSAALIPTSLLPAALGYAGITYFFVALVLGLALWLVGFWASQRRTNFRAKWLMHATVIYIPALLGILMFDRIRAF
jgi:protoheme IX farnesyltransferase